MPACLPGGTEAVLPDWPDLCRELPSLLSQVHGAGHTGDDATAAYQRISAIGNGYIRAVERTMPSDTISSQLAG